MPDESGNPSRRIHHLAMSPILTIGNSSRKGSVFLWKMSS